MEPTESLKGSGKWTHNAQLSRFNYKLKDIGDKTYHNKL